MATRNWKLGIITATLGDLKDRFCGSYKDPLSLSAKLNALQSESGLEGIELVYDENGDENDAADINRLCNESGISVCAVNAPLSFDKKWKFGTFTANAAEIRQAAVAVTKETMDFAAEVGAPLVNLWLGQDGFDYPFQADYGAQWQRLVENVRDCAGHNPDIKLCLESKPREPRNRALLDATPTTLLAAREIDRENVGITIDAGHVLMDQRNMAQAVELAARTGLLFHLHINDNYGTWDDDMIVGSLHVIETAELFFTLRRIGYDRWCSIDIFPFREDPVRAAEESIRASTELDELVERIGFEKLRELVSGDDPTGAIRVVRDALLAT